MILPTGSGDHVDRGPRKTVEKESAVAQAVNVVGRRPPVSMCSAGSVRWKRADVLGMDMCGETRRQ